jgi:hypothetical protein
LIKTTLLVLGVIVRIRRHLMGTLTVATLITLDTVVAP